MDSVIDFSCGTLGGIANVYVGQPLDTIKVKMQMFPNMYRNALQCGLETFKKDGLGRGLYAGTVPALAANVSENAILFCSYGLCQKGIAALANKKDINELNSFQNALSGSGAAFFASLALCPTELVKCQLQAAREVSGCANLGPFKLCKQIYQQSGIRGFYHGLVSTFAREMPGYFFFFGMYEFSRSRLTPKNKTKDDIGILKTALCGGLGGVSLWISIFPADVVKSRIQINPNSPLAKGGFFNALKTIVKNEGIKKLYSGLGPTIIRSFFATGALFVTVEESKKLFNKLRNKND